MSEIRFIVLLVVFHAGLVALFAVLAALFPRPLRRATAIAEAMPLRAALIGLVNLLFFGAALLVVGALGQRTENGIIGLAGLLLLALIAIALSFGLAAVALLVGRRLGWSRWLPQESWGSLALSAACLVPFVGWFGLLPYAAALGVGSFILSFFEQSLPAGD